MDINLHLASEFHKSIGDKIKKAYNNEILLSDKPFTQLTLFELRSIIENEIKSKLPNEQNYGLAFPIGLNADSIVAHYTPTKIKDSILDTLPYYLNGNTSLNKCKLLKVDYGVHINGYIIDSAFSLNLDKSTESKILIESSEEAVNKVIKEIGLDSRLDDLADIAHEVVSSYEINDKPIKLVNNVYSHNIDRWKIHGHKFIKPDYKDLSNHTSYLIQDNEQYAIEFYTTNGLGKGKLVEISETYSHFSISEYYSNKPVPIFEIDRYNKIIHVIQQQLYSLPFCPNYLLNYKIKYGKKKLSSIKLTESLNELHNLNILNSYPPIIEYDTSASVAQHERTISIVDGIVREY